MAIYTRAYHNAEFHITTCDGSNTLCYILLPKGTLNEMTAWAAKAATEHNCNIVLISGMDWNKDMTPWPADGVMKERKPFSGGAAMYMKALLEDYVPYIERLLKSNSPKRYLLGISLSGLFAIWSLTSTNVFCGVASISGSLWYDGFTEWMADKTPASETKVYISLGVKEKNAPDRRMATVEKCTEKIEESLEGRGVDVTFELVSGTHFSPAAPRFEKALSAILVDIQ